MSVCAVSSLFRCSFAGVCLWFAACHRPIAQPAPTPQPIASPAPAEIVSWIPPLRILKPQRDPAQPLTPGEARDRDAMYEKYGPPTTAAAAVQQAAKLQQEYRLEKEYLPRVEIIYRLADASTPQSRGALSQLFFSERDPDLRVQMVTALPFVDAGDINLSLPILQEALKPGQPRELREAGLDAIQSLNDPQTLPLLLPLLNDPDEELRETVTTTAEYYKEVLQLDRP